MNGIKFSVIICCYNTLPLIKKTLNAVLESTRNDTEIILVNNHPPYPDVQLYLRQLRNSRVRVLDPNKNIGCLMGFQFGAERARGGYIVKLDDDTIVPKNNWLVAMAQSLRDNPNLAYVGLIVPIYRIGRFPQIQRPLYTLEIYDDLVHFACIMMKRTLWCSSFVTNDSSLYGGDEEFYMQRANALGLRKGYLVSHRCQHLARLENSDPLYGAWKIFYLSGSHVDFTEWRETFTLGESELNILQQYQYPEEQLTLLRNTIKQ